MLFQEDKDGYAGVEKIRPPRKVYKLWMLKATNISLEVDCQGFVNFSCLTVALSNRVECRTQIPACLLPGKHAAHTFSLHGAIANNLVKGCLTQTLTLLVTDYRTIRRDFFLEPGGEEGTVPERPISPNLGLKFCSVFLFCLPLCCLE